MGALTIIGLIVLAIFVLWVLYKIGFLELFVGIINAFTDSDGGSGGDSGGFGGGNSGGGGSSDDW